jgi:hypothetical protein
MPKTVQIDTESPFGGDTDKNAEVSASTAVVTASEDAQPLATPHLGVYDNDWEESDMRLPTLRLVAKVGPLSEQFTPGNIIIDGELPISDGKTPVQFTVVGVKKYFREHIDFGSEGTPKILTQLADVHAAGGTVDWADDPETGERLRPSYNRVMECTILVKAPDEHKDSSHFPYEAPDKSRHALVVYTLERTAYSRVAKKVITALRHHLKAEPLAGSFLLTTHVADIGPNKVIVPEIAYGPRNDGKFVEWAATLAV